MLHVAMCRVYVAAAYESLNYVDSNAYNNGLWKLQKNYKNPKNKFTVF